MAASRNDTPWASNSMNRCRANDFGRQPGPFGIRRVDNENLQTQAYVASIAGNHPVADSPALPRSRGLPPGRRTICAACRGELTLHRSSVGPDLVSAIPSRSSPYSSPGRRRFGDELRQFIRRQQVEHQWPRTKPNSLESFRKSAGIPSGPVYLTVATADRLHQLVCQA